MARDRDRPPREGKKVRVPFRRNRSPRSRDNTWTQRSRDSGGQDIDDASREQIAPKGDLSRQRTIIDRAGLPEDADLRSGVVIAARGLYADVDDGQRVWPCTIRRILRTRLIAARGPLAVGDHVRFRADLPRDGATPEGAIESVDPRRGQLRRRVGRRIQTIAANIDQAIVVASAGQPDFKPHLIDRYIVAALFGEITPIICLNKIDLDLDGEARRVLEYYEQLGYATLPTSAQTGTGIDALRERLANKASVIAGQSGVGKSSLLNVVHPGLGLRIGDMIEKYDKGRHTTTTATLIRLDFGGYVVDTPGIRGLDLSIVPRGEIEAYFVELLPHIPHCKYPDCTHTHEGNCAVKEAVERGEVRPDRYESYVRLFTEPSEN